MLRWIFIVTQKTKREKQNDRTKNNSNQVEFIEKLEVLGRSRQSQSKQLNRDYFD